jgi:hypothetical protein
MAAMATAKRNFMEPSSNCPIFAGDELASGILVFCVGVKV